MNKKDESINEIVSPNKLVLKKAHVPLGALTRIALKNMWKKKIRFLIMFLICGVSLSFLSFTIELNGEKLRQNVYTMVENGYRYTNIYKHVPATKDEIKEDPYNEFNYEKVDNNAYSDIKSKLPNHTIYEYVPVNINYALENIENKNYFYTGKINNIMKFDKTNNYELLYGRLPNEDEPEILITDYLVAAFKYFNIFPNISNDYDFLNQRMKLNSKTSFKIVGIIKTNYLNWTHFANVPVVETSDKTNYSFRNDFIVMNSVILPTAYYENEMVGNIPYIYASNTIGYNQTIGTWYTEAVVNGEAVKFSGNNLLPMYHDKVNLCGYYGSNSEFIPFGRNVKSDDEIVIPYYWVENVFKLTFTRPISYAPTDYEINKGSWEQVENKKITLTFTNISGKVVSKEYTIVGLSNTRINIGNQNINVAQLTMNEVYSIYKSFYTADLNILFQIPNDSKKAYDQFNEAIEKGYVIDVFAYKNDIESYNVDPLINFASKAGLFVFAAFTIGIMWTIITIEIVDSKKEIGILRSIGLSGGKVSFIFTLQICIVVFFSYILGNLLSYYLIPIYNSGIHDELNKITLYMYTFTFRSPLYLFGFVVLMTIIATSIPLNKIMRHKIIDIINERDD